MMDLCTVISHVSRPSGIVASNTDRGAAGPGRRASNLLVRLVEEEEMWEVPDLPQGVLSHNWGESQRNRTVACIVLKAKAKM
ncbi:hypothetical protein TNCV_494671 [Trichonephila clavipes]|nr:hypothetical protein TNCV_494671 [Trichonephila clavipes]